MSIGRHLIDHARLGPRARLIGGERSNIGRQVIDHARLAFVGAVPPADDNNLLLETGGDQLLETGGKMELE